MFRGRDGLWCRILTVEGGHVLALFFLVSIMVAMDRNLLWLATLILMAGSAGLFIGHFHCAGKLLNGLPVLYLLYLVMFCSCCCRQGADDDIDYLALAHRVT